MLEITTTDTITFNDLAFSAYGVISMLAIIATIFWNIQVRGEIDTFLRSIFSILLLAAGGILPLGLSHMSVATKINEENTASIETTFGVAFNAKAAHHNRNILPNDGDYIIYHDVKRTDENGLYETLLIELDGNMVTLSVPETRGSTDYVPLNPVS